MIALNEKQILRFAQDDRLGADEERMEVPPGSLVMGAPGKVRRPVTAEDLEKMKEGVQSYVDLLPFYRSERSK